MFDWDDVPEELGGPNQRALEVEAQVEEEERYESEEDEEEDNEESTGDRQLQSLLCLDEDEVKKKKPKPKPKAKPPPAAAAGVWEDRATLRSLRISELKKRLAECGIQVPSNVVEKDDLVSLLLGNPRAAAEPRRAPSAEPRRALAAEPKRPTYEEQRPTYDERQPAYEEQRPRHGEQRPRYEEPAPVATAPRTVSRGGADVGGTDASRSSQTRPPTKRLEKMAAEVDKEGSRGGDSSLQNCLKQQFQRMKEQRRRDEARRVATEQRSEAERLDLQVKEKGADGPGTYMITKKTIATGRADRGGGKIEDLIPGQIVEVLEVVECEGRVRARVADPPCWFSVLNNQSGTRFAVKDGRLAKPLCLKNTAEEQSEQKPRLHTRKAPSKFAAFSKAAASVREPSPEPQIETPAFREPPAVVEPPAPSKPSPLALAAKTGSMKKVMKVLQEGANVNASNARGETPLFTAAASGSLDVTAALLLHSADPGRKSKSGLMAQDAAPPGPVRSLLELAHGNFESAAMQSVMGVLDPLLKPQMMHMLQEKMQAKMSGQDARGGPGPGPSPGAFAPPARAAPAPAQAPPRREEPPMPPRALAAEPAKAGSESALTRAAKSGSLKDVMKLLQGGADPNVADTVGETPLFEAAAHGFTDVTAALLVYRGDPDKRSGTGLLAGDLTTDGTVRGLLAFFRGEDMVSEQLEFLLEGLGETMREVIGRMVHSLEASKRGLADGEVGGEAPVKVVPPRDRIIDTGHLSGAPLASAAREGDLDEVRRLLEERADPNITDELGETPLFEAVASGFDDVTAILLLHKADPERRSDAGGVAADIAVDLPGKLLLDFFKGVELSNDDKYVIVYEALRDPEVREAISGRFRAANMQEAYKHTLRKLRA